MALLLFALLVLVFYFSNRYYRGILNPITIFIGLFLSAFFVLFSSDFISADLITGEMWAMYIVSMIAYFLGVIIYNNSRKRAIIIKNSSYYSSLELDNQEHFATEIYILFVIVLFSTIKYWIDCFSAFGINGLFPTMLFTREEDIIGKTSSIFLYLKMISIFLSPYVLIYMLKYNVRKPIFVGILLFTFLANIAYSRATIFTIVIIDACVLVYFVYGKKTHKKWFMAVAVGILFIFFYFFSSTQVVFGKEFALSGKFLGVPIGDNFATALSYFSGSLVSPRYYFEMHKDVPFLGFTARSIYDNIGPLWGYHEQTVLYQPIEFVFIPFSFNTAAIQYYIFEEGGWLWFVFFFGFMGYLTNKIFCAYMIKHDRFSLMSLSFISMLLLLSIRSYEIAHISSIIYLLVLLLLFVINRKIVIKK